MKTCVISLCMLAVGLLPGCNLFDSHAQTFDTLSGLATDAATRLADGSVGQFQVSGQAINPGIVVEAAIVYRAGARYEGLAGQFGAAGQGQFGERSSDVGPVLEIIKRADLSNAARRAIISRWVDDLLDIKPEQE